MSNLSFEILDQTKPIVVFGRDGQIGKALQIFLKDLKVSSIFLGRGDCDLSNKSLIRELLNHYQPQVIINAAAYTNVDKAESEQELAFAINAEAPAVMAQYMANVTHGILVHYSTDYVFADTKQTAYLETDIAGPAEQLSVYGQSKLSGEKAIEETFNLVHDFGDFKYQDEFPRYFILRTSWVYGGGDNFIRTILHLASERDKLKIVADQIGVPTSAEWLAKMTIELIDSNVESGMYHVVPDGEASWYELAVFAIEMALKDNESLDIKSKNILPLTTLDYPTLAKRPHNCRLDNSKFKKLVFSFTEQYPNWQEQVKAYVRESVATSPWAVS